jgi:serine/threonine-protein kinase
MEQQAQRLTRDPLIGSVLHERYHVLRRIGRGGMGVVYLAEHVLIGRKYALKVLSEHATATEEMLARFHREAVAAAAVGSDHVVEVTDMGRLEDGTCFIVLEYLEGVELAGAVFSEGPFGADRAVNIACQLCDALTAVHEKGIVHRDLKPENLFLISRAGSADFLKVLDFGVCKLLEGAADHTDSDQPALTRTNASLGTPQYMAPEQFQNSARVDHRADIHAVGAILYFMLTGKPPFDAPTLAQLFMRVCVEPPPALLAKRPDLPAGLDAVIRRALSKQPEDRFASSAALKHALLPFAALRTGQPASSATLPVAITHSRECAGAAETAPELDVFEPSWLPAPKHRWLSPLLAGGLGAVLLSVAVWGTWALPASEARSAPPAASRSAGHPAQFSHDAAVRTQNASQDSRGSGTTGEPQGPPPTQTAQPRSKPAMAARKQTAPAPKQTPPTETPEETAPTSPSEAPATGGAPPANVQPLSTQTGGLYRFPRRTLKDVF